MHPNASRPPRSAPSGERAGPVWMLHVKRLGFLILRGPRGSVTLTAADLADNPAAAALLRSLLGQAESRMATARRNETHPRPKAPIVAEGVSRGADAFR